MKLFSFIKKHFYILVLIFFFVVVLLVNIRINIFKYRNYDFGKFDLGNMTQMVWNTLHGRPLYLTDYFGGNVPRWSMSHVDPILLIFVPIFAIFQHPLTLVFSQVILVLCSAFLIYKISLLELKSKLSSLCLGLAFLFYPAVGYLTSQTGFHGVTAVMPFFLGAFYVFEKMYQEQNFSLAGKRLFWFLIVLLMSGKEQLPLYVFIYGLFILLFRKTKETLTIALPLLVVSFLWFVLAFFVIIPSNAHYRVESYQKFSQLMNIEQTGLRDVEMENYFLSRYDAFGGSYFDILKGIITDPQKAIRVAFGGEKVKNFNRTFEPLLFTPFLYPQLLLIALPDFMINYLTSAGGIGTSEIENHRVSMIIPVLFISLIYGISYIGGLFGKKWSKYRSIFIILLSGTIFAMTVRTTFSYNNPVFLWLSQSISKRLAFVPAYAKFDRASAQIENLQIGTVHKIAYLDNKDIECADRVVAAIPKKASVSGPDYLGSHLSMRETYAIFPALYNETDYVIVDVFSRKILTILNTDTSLVKNVVGNLLKSDEYKLNMGCGNLFVFQKVPKYTKETLLPLQEKYHYQEKVSYEIYNSLYVVDYSFPQEVKRGEPQKGKIVYVRRENKEVADFILYVTYLNPETGEFYQAANLPSFSIMEPEDWDVGTYYLEDVDIAIPQFLEPGNYRVFVGMSNLIKTRNLYIGDILIK